ncbi:MAG: hypothetical protein ACYTDY_14010 [Planctomycetota bacterium]|jgi:hypothetical protein
MSETAERQEGRDEEMRPDFFSCAFCHTSSPKPFKICESCGSSQPDPEEKEEE